MAAVCPPRDHSATAASPPRVTATQVNAFLVPGPLAFLGWGPRPNTHHKFFSAELFKRSLYFLVAPYFAWAFKRFNLVPFFWPFEIF